MFTSISETRTGRGWIVKAWTVQDLEFDPEGRYIYAEGLVEVEKPVDETQKQLVHMHGHNVWTNKPFDKPIKKVYTLNNRGWSVVKGRRKWSPPFYKLEDANTCLTNLLHRLVTLGRQSE